MKFQGAVIVPSLRQDNNCSLKLRISLSKPIYVRNGLKSARNIQSIFCTTYPNLTIFSTKVHMLLNSAIIRLIATSFGLDSSPGCIVIYHKSMRAKLLKSNIVLHCSNIPIRSLIWGLGRHDKSKR